MPRPKREANDVERRAAACGGPEATRAPGRGGSGGFCAEGRGGRGSAWLWDGTVKVGYCDTDGMDEVDEDGEDGTTVVGGTRGCGRGGSAESADERDADERNF